MNSSIQFVMLHLCHVLRLRYIIYIVRVLVRAARRTNQYHIHIFISVCNMCTYTYIIINGFHYTGLCNWRLDSQQCFSAYQRGREGIQWIFSPNIWIPENTKTRDAASVQGSSNILTYSRRIRFIQIACPPPSSFFHLCLPHLGQVLHFTCYSTCQLSLEMPSQIHPEVRFTNLLGVSQSSQDQPWQQVTQCALHSRDFINRNS